MSKEIITKSKKYSGIWECEREGRNGKIQKRYLVKVYRWTPNDNVKKPGLKGYAQNETQALALKKRFEEQLDRLIANRKRSTVLSFFENVYRTELESTHAITSFYNLCTAFEGKILPFFGQKFVDEVTCGDINDFIHVHLKDLSTSTRKNYRKFISGFFKSAVSRRLISVNPVDGAKGIKGASRQERYLSPQQLSLLLNYVIQNKHEWRYHFALSALTGMRVNEARALRFEDINFESNLIHVRNTYDRRTGFKPYTKNYSTRFVPLTPDLKALLIERKREEGLSDADFVLPQLRMWLTGEQGKILHDLLRLLGLPEMRYYDFRASFAVAMALEGKQILVISEILGHGSIEMTARYLRKLGALLKGATDCLTGLIDPQLLAQPNKDKKK